LLLRKGGGSGDRKVHMFIPPRIIAMGAGPSTLRRGGPSSRDFDSQGFARVFGKGATFGRPFDGLWPERFGWGQFSWQVSCFL
jgi:hypothetical protein